MQLYKYGSLSEIRLGAWCPSQDRSRSTILTDFSRYGRNGVYSPAAWSPSEGKIAAYYSGSVNTGQIPINLSPHRVITVSVWMNLAAYSTTRILLEYSVNYNNASSFVFLQDSAGTMAFLQRQFTSPAGYNGGTIVSTTSNVWNHYLFTLNRNSGTANSVTASVNGKPVTVTQTASIDMQTDFTNSDLYLMSRAGTSFRTTGFLDDMAIYAGDVQRLAPILALRRGVAYETVRRRSYSLPGGSTRGGLINNRSLINSGGLINSNSLVRGFVQ